MCIGLISAGAVECQKSKIKVAEDNFEIKGTTGTPGNLAPKRARINHEKQVLSLTHSNLV